MKTAIALIIKFVMTMIAAWVSFSLFDNVFLTIIVVIAGAATILNYFIGDLLILPRLGNIAASITDGIFAAITAYILLVFNNFTNTMTSILIFAIMIVAFEFFFHMYLIKADIVERNDSGTKSNRLNMNKLNHSTETAKEIHPYGDIWKPSNKSNDDN